MSAQSASTYRRLILELCNGAADADTMRAAAECARLLGLDLHCLFIEDEAVLALAELPFAREIRLPTHEWRPINADTIAAEFGQAAEQTRRLLNEIIQGVGVSSEFQVLRGDPAACIADLCRTNDIVVLAESGAASAHARHSLTRLHMAAYQSAASVLLLPLRFKPRAGPIVAVVRDADDASLAVACSIAAAANEELVVLLHDPAMDSAAIDRVKQRAVALGTPPERISVNQVHGARADDVLRALAGLRGRMIVMTRGTSADSQPASLLRTAATLGAPVLLIEAVSDRQ